MTPDPDSITAVMVRAVFRTEKLDATAERDPPPTTVRVITTRYQDAVPFYIENGFAHVGATAANAVVKAWTDKGGKVLVPVATGADQADHRVDQDAGREQAQRSATRSLTLRDSKPGRDALEAVGYRGFVHRIPSSRARPSPGSVCSVRRRMPCGPHARPGSHVGRPRC